MKGNNRTRGKTKLTSFPRDRILSALTCYIFRLSLEQPCSKKQRKKERQKRATTGRNTFEFDQGHVTKNQPITVLVSGYVTISFVWFCKGKKIYFWSCFCFFFRTLLEFWKAHYLKRGKDCSALEQSSCIDFENWKEVVDILVNDNATSNTSVLHYLPAAATRTM